MSRDTRGISDTPLIDHLVMRKFVSGPPSYRSIHKRVRDRKPSLRESSCAVCGFRTEFFEKRNFFGSPLGDHVLTCKQHTGSIRGHNHVMGIVACLSRDSKIGPVRVNHKVSTTGDGTRKACQAG